MNLLEQIQEGQGQDALTNIKNTLGKKLVAAIHEARQQVMSEVYGDLAEAGSVDDYHRVLSQHGFAKAGEHTSPTTNSSGAGGLYGGGITSHKYEHASHPGHVVRIHQKAGLLRGDKPRVSFSAEAPKGLAKHGKTVNALQAHLDTIKESFLPEEKEINRSHPSYKAGFKSYQTHVEKPAKTVAGQSKKNNYDALTAKKKHISKFGTLPERLDAGKHFQAGHDAAHAIHAYKSHPEMFANHPEKVKEAFGGSFKAGEFKSHGGRPMDKRKQAIKNAKQAAFATKSWDGSLLTPEQRQEHIAHAKEICKEHGISWEEIVGNK